MDIKKYVNFKKIIKSFFKKKHDFFYFLKFLAFMITKKNIHFFAFFIYIKTFIFSILSIHFENQTIYV